MKNCPLRSSRTRAVRGPLLLDQSTRAIQIDTTLASVQLLQPRHFRLSLHQRHQNLEHEKGVRGVVLVEWDLDPRNGIDVFEFCVWSIWCSVHVQSLDRR